MNKILPLMAIFAVLFPISSYAVDMKIKERDSKEINYLIVSTTAFDVVDDDVTYGAGGEFRFKTIADFKIFKHEVNIRPLFGAFRTDDRVTYSYAGIAFETAVTDDVYFSSSLATGIYDEAEGEKLGGKAIFKSSVEVGYELEDFSRIGVSFAHLSNADIYNENPGVETIMISYSMPLIK